MLTCVMKLPEHEGNNTSNSSSNSSMRSGNVSSLMFCTHPPPCVISLLSTMLNPSSPAHFHRYVRTPRFLHSHFHVQRPIHLLRKMQLGLHTVWNLDSST